MKIEHLKFKIILNVLKFVHSGNEPYKIAALSDLKQFAKYYHLTVKKVPKIETMVALIEFIEAGKPADVCINRLYYSL